MSIVFTTEEGIELSNHASGFYQHAWLGWWCFGIVAYGFMKFQINNNNYACKSIFLVLRNFLN